MSVKARIILTAVIPLMLAASAISMHLYSAGDSSQAASQIAAIKTLYASFGKLELLVQEYAVHMDNRTSAQWAKAYSDTGRAIEEANGKQLSGSDRLAVELITKSYRNIGYLYNQYGNQQGGARFSARITSRIVQELQQTSPEIDGIIARNRSLISAATSGDTTTAIALLGMTALFSIMAAAYLYRGISSPLSMLHNGVSALGRGETGFRLAIDRNDEFGHLASEFNRMADLKQRTENSLKDSEQRMRDTFDGLNSPAAILDSNGAVIQCNRKLLEITARQRNEVIGKNWFDLFMHDNAVARQQFSQIISRGEATEEITAEISSKSGKKLTVSWNFMLQRDITGGPVSSVIMSGTDITLQVAGEKKLRTVMEALQSLVDTTPESMLLISRDGAIQAANRSAAELLNRHHDDMYGANYFKLLPQDLDSERRQKIEQVFNLSMPTEFSDIQKLAMFSHRVYPVRGADGMAFAAAIFSSHPNDTQQTSLPDRGIMGSLHQNSDDLETANNLLRKELQEISKKNQQAERLLADTLKEVASLKADIEILNTIQSVEPTAMDTELLADISHEIRTPMNAITGLVQLALQTPLTNRQRDYLDSINSSANSLLMIINDILDFARIESGKMHLEPVPFSLSEVLERAEMTVRLHALEKGMTLSTSISNDLPDTLTGDPVRLEQVISKLAGMAAKIGSNGEISICVTRQDIALTEKTVLDFSVACSGVESTPDELQMMLAPLDRAQDTPPKLHTGAWFGLSISCHIVKLMGGELKIEFPSASEALFRFNGIFEHATPQEVAAEKRIKPSEKSIYLALHGKRALVAEDSRINLLIVQEVLEHSGMIVEVAKNGQEAVDLVKDHGDEFSCVLMDIQMPVMDGISATKAIRELYSFEQLPVFAMTSNTLESDRLHCMEAGMNGHISKPIETSELVEIITGHLAFSDIPADAIDEAMAQLQREESPTSSIPGIDLEAALQRLNGNRELLDRLIRLFAYEHGSMASEISQHIREGDLASAARLVHTLKGVATNLAAEELREASERLEAELKAEKHMESPDIFRQFEAALHKVCSHAEEMKELKIAAAAKTDISPSSIDECLKRLRGALRTNDLAAHEAFIELKYILNGKAAPQKLDYLGETIDRLDYRQALVVLEEILTEKR